VYNFEQISLGALFILLSCFFSIPSGNASCWPPLAPPGPNVERIGDFVLELFWRDGCEPNVSALLDLCPERIAPHV
jgi:hypothetical protein